MTGPFRTSVPDCCLSVAALASPWGRASIFYFFFFEYYFSKREGWGLGWVGKGEVERYIERKRREKNML